MSEKLSKEKRAQINHAMTKVAKPLISKILFGLGGDAVSASRRVVSRSGALDHRKLPTVTGPGAKTWDTVKSLLIGKKPIEVVKQRALQGGILGKGGLLRGELAFDPEMVDAYRKAYSSGGFSAGAREVLRNHKMSLGGDLVNAGMMTATPAYGIYQGVKHDDPSLIGRTVGEGLAWGLGGPFGIVGALGIETPMSYLGGQAGEVVGKLKDNPESIRSMSKGNYVTTTSNNNPNYVARSQTTQVMPPVNVHRPAQQYVTEY